MLKIWFVSLFWTNYIVCRNQQSIQKALWIVDEIQVWCLQWPTELSHQWTKWKCVTEISIRYVKTKKRTLANYEEYPHIVSDIINIPKKVKTSTQVGSLNWVTEGSDYTQGPPWQNMTFRIYWKWCHIVYHIGFKWVWLETKKLHNLGNAQGKMPKCTEY